MRKEEFKTFAMYLTGVAETFSQKISAEQIMLYFEILADEFENIDEFKKAARKLLKSWTYSYMPKPAHFIEAKKEFSSESVEIIAQKAWDSVIKALDKGIGYNKSAEFEDKLIPAVVELCGGFERLASKTFEELEWVKKEFIKTYKSAIDGEIELEAKDVLPMLEEAKAITIKANYPVLNVKVVNTPAIENKASTIVKSLALSKRM